MIDTRETQMRIRRKLAR